MSWLKNNYANIVGATDSVVSRTAIIEPTATREELVRLLDLIVNPTAIGLAGLFVKATDFISRVMYVPFKPSNTNIKKELIFYTPSIVNSGLPIYLVDESKQLYTLGEYLVPRYFNNFADYNGYTKIDVYLPYFGYVSVNPNDVLGKYLQIRMGFDIISGQATYYICVNDNSVCPDFSTNPIANNIDDNSRILSVHSCMLGCEIPLGSTNASDIMRNLLLGSVKVAGTAAMYGSALSSGAFVTKSKTKTVTNIKKKNASTGNRMKLVGRKISETETSRDRSAVESYQMKSDCFSTALSALSSMHLEATSDKPNGMMGVVDGSMNVHIIIYRPKIKNGGERYGHFYGYPVGEILPLSNVSGYTEISSIHIEGQGFESITDEEKDILEQAFSNGIIL